MNVVLDTNTVISSLFWNGAPRHVLDLARSGTITLFTSPDLLAELAASLAITVRPDKIEPVVKDDPDDDKVPACAKTANSEVIGADFCLFFVGVFAPDGCT